MANTHLVLPQNIFSNMNINFKQEKKHFHSAEKVHVLCFLSMLLPKLHHFSGRHLFVDFDVS